MHITTKQLALIGGIIALLGVCGIGFYFQTVMLAVAPVQPKPTGYTAAVLVKELQAGGVFTKVAVLRDVPASEASAIQYTQGELGKSDLTKLE